MQSRTNHPPSVVVVVLPFLALAIHPIASVVGRWQLAGSMGGGTYRQSAAAPVQSAAQRVPVTFSEGFRTDTQDRGRPVVLIAAGLRVPADVFRAAFRNVTPASGGRAPEPEQVRRNKSALLSALAPYGVTNERLDTVSDYYRYRADRGQRWRHRPAAAYATVRDGVVTGFTITDPGAGYSSAPVVTVPGFEKLPVRTAVAYGEDLERNGSISELALSRR